MTILLRIERPGLELTVCGMISREWLDGLVREANSIADAQGGLTQGQRMWRDIHRESLDGSAPASARPPREPDRRSRVPRPRRRGYRFDLVDTEEL